MSVADVAAQVSRALAAVATARQVLAHARDGLTEVRDIWAAIFDGSHDPDVAELPALAHHCLERVGELHGQLQRSEDLLRVYLDSIGATKPGPGSTTPAKPDPTPSPPAPAKPTGANRVERARASLPPTIKLGAGEKTRGKWWTADRDDMTDIASGSDELSKRVDDLLAERGLRQRITRANDAELKLAAHMVDNDVTTASLVINNRPCTGRLSCDSLLPVLLPPGSSLTVYGAEQDGSSFVKTYHGGS